MKERMTRREAIKKMASVTLGGAAILASDSHSAQAAGSHTQPNIIFILADDLGYGDLVCYAQQVIQTPCLDQMAVEGVRFTDCYAGSTVCAPSRCCLMTGLHSGHARVRGNARVPLRPEDLTVAQVLKQAGYATGIVGKWGLGEPDSTGIPNHQGFDYWFGYLNQGRAHNYYPDYLWLNQEQYPLEGNTDGRREQYSHDLFTEHALQLIREHKEGPFFLYLAYTLPHANNELGRETGDGMEVPDYGPYADEDWASPQKGHAAMITRLDRDCGRVLELLKELNIDDNTIVFFTSDNGPHKEGGADPAFFNSSGPLRGYKRDLYEGGIRVPMIVRWPGTIAAGTNSDLPWAFWDFPATAAEIAGTQWPQDGDGVSVLPTILGQEQEVRRNLYWEFQEQEFKQAVRMRNWKAVRVGLNGPAQLYDLATDLGELNDVADQHSGLVARAEELFRRARIDSPEFPIREAQPQT